MKKTRYNIEKYSVFQLCQKYKENQIERNKTKYEQGLRYLVLRYDKYEWHFIVVVPPSLCHSAFGTFFQWTWTVFIVTKKIFEEERIKYIPYPKQDLRHWETGRKGIRKQTAPARQETTKCLYRGDGTGGLPGTRKASSFHGCFIFPFYKRKMHGSVFSPTKIISRLINVK